MTTEEEILRLWSQVARNGVKDLISFLVESDFFEAPCSVKHHLSRPGGLADHSWNVYEILRNKVEYYQLNIPEESIIICSLGHDLCKINVYQVGGEPCSEAQYNYLSSLWSRQGMYLAPDAISKYLDGQGMFVRSIPGPVATLLINWLKNRPSEPVPDLPITYSYHDTLPLGHGEKSLSILQDFIQLTDIEKLAIRWHMGAWDLSDYSGRYSFDNAVKIHPLVGLLTTADSEASWILEREEGETNANYAR